MKAVVYKGAFEVAVENVPDPRIERAGDAIVRITTANICGSDLHPYEGRAPLDAGMVLGHENMGIVEEIGSGVDRIGVGDRVSVPFNIACGTCRNCVAGWTCACLRANPSGRPTAGYGYPMMGPYWGGRPSTCGCRGPTSTCSSCPPGPNTRTTSPCCRTSSPPATTAPSSPGSAPETAWRSSAPGRSG